MSISGASRKVNSSRLAPHLHPIRFESDADIYIAPMGIADLPYWPRDVGRIIVAYTESTFAEKLTRVIEHNKARDLYGHTFLPLLGPGHDGTPALLIYPADGNFDLRIMTGNHSSMRRTYQSVTLDQLTRALDAGDPAIVFPHDPIAAHTTRHWPRYKSRILKAAAATEPANWSDDDDDSVWGFCE